jgi:CheY-like chemotaxis protein
MTTQALRKVLVVDDDPVVGRSIDRILSPRGYAVISAASGAEALDRLAREDYDVVYTDIKMPGMDGLEVAERIKASRPWLPVVIVTGYGSEANEARAKDIGVAGFLRKPLSPEMVETSAHDALRAPMPILVPAPAAAPAAAPARHPRLARAGRFAANVGLFFAAPFIGLAYVLAFPFVGLGLLGLTGYRAWKERGKRG